jgi:hypothetical protein
MANLLTLDEYKAAKGLSGVTEDAKITPLLASVSQLVRTYCNREFTTYYGSDKTEYFTIKWNDQSVQLNETPIVSITSVSERESIAGAYTALGSSEYYTDTDTDCIFRIDTNGTGFTSFKPGPASVRVVYKAGYAATPADLKLALIDLVTYYLKEEYKPSKAIASVNVQNNTSSSQSNSPDFPDHIKRILDLYRTY